MTTNQYSDAMAAAVAAKVAGDKAALKRTWKVIADAQRTDEESSIKSRIQAWRAFGEVIAAAVKLADADAKLHEVAQDKCETAAAACGIVVAKDVAKKYLRANLYCSDDIVTKAADAFGTAAGPMSGSAADVARWCQAQTADGRKHMKDSPNAADAKASVSLAAKTARTAAAKTASETAAKAALTEGQTILAADESEAFGPLSAARWQAFTDAELDRIAAIAGSVKAAKVAAAKAAKAAEPKKSAKAAKAADASANDVLMAKLAELEAKLAALTS